MTSLPASAPPEASPFQQGLRTYLRAGYPILYVVTAEEQRAIDLISGALADGKTQPPKGARVVGVARALHA